jgi:hypothetical protein
MPTSPAKEKREVEKAFYFNYFITQVFVLQNKEQDRN